MNHQPSPRLGALSGKWDVPAPEEFKALLQTDPEVESRFYESNLGPPTGSTGSAASADFEIYSDEEGRHRWRLRRRDSGGVLAESGKSYPSRASCREAIGLVRDLGTHAGVEEQA